MAQRFKYQSLENEGNWTLLQIAAVSVSLGVVLGLVTSAVTPASQNFVTGQTAVRPVVQAIVGPRASGSYVPLGAATGANMYPYSGQDEAESVPASTVEQGYFHWSSLLLPLAALGGLFAWFKASKVTKPVSIDIEASAGWSMAAGACQRQKRPAIASNPLGLAEYQNAEAQWAMMAATAFVGTKAPDFEATAVFDGEFVDIKLSQYRGKKYVVLFFYPLDFTFVCPTEITAFSDREAEFSAIDTQILGVSIDSQFSHLAWMQTPRNQGGLGDIAYPLVSDLKKEIAEGYGVLSEGGVALRGLFIIDKEGIIQHATINNLAFGRNVDETLRVLQAVQHVQANPDEVCPAGWKKGDKTMKPDPEGSKEYFKAI